MREFAYDAFISYCHRDLKWARWLQRRLETFPVPRGADGAKPARRRLRAFRDQTDLNGVDLTSALQQELRASRSLIVVCSPQSAASRWVEAEIDFFRSLEEPGQVIAFIVSGEPDSDNPALECYPPALRSADGRYTLGANVQEIGRSKAFLKVVSLLIDVRFNRLVDREKQRRRRTALAVAAGALAVGTVTGALLWRNAEISRRNRQLSFDIYGAAIVSLAQKESLEPAEFEFIRTSAEAGNTYAAFMLADCYDNGWGVERNEALAVKWYERAAEDGDAVSMVALANCYYNGTGTETDFERAYYWNGRAAEEGFGPGMLNVGIMNELGRGIPQNLPAAFEWYRKSAEAGFELGMFNVARCYRDGIGTEADLEKAFDWMSRLAATGNSDGMYNLAMMYQCGYGTPENPELAYEWYRKAAESGDANAQYMTGWCIENRYGVSDLALEWYVRAAEAGSAEAAEAVDRLTARQAAGSTDGNP